METALWPLNSVVWGVCWRIKWDPTPLKERPDDTKGVWYLGCTRHSVSPFLGPGGPCTLDLFSGTSLGQLGVGKMPCTTSRRLGRSRAGLPGRRARALALVPQRILCCCPWFYVCLGSPSIKSLHVSEFASFMNLVVPCLI